MNLATKFPTAAIKHLKQAGFVGELVAHHSESLLEFKLVTELEVGAPEFRKPKRSEDPLVPVAELFMKVACAWEPQAQMFGVNLIGRFDEVFFALMDTPKWRDVYNRIPAAHHTEEITIHAMNRKGLSDYEVNGNYLSDHVMREVVGRYPSIIERRKNEDGLSVAPYDVLLKACERNGSLLRSIDPSLFTEELVDQALHSAGYVFETLPSQYVTAERCLRLVERHGHLGSIPQELMTEKMVAIGLSRSARNAEFVPAAFLTEEMLLSSIKQNADVVNYLPKEMQHVDFYRKASQANGKVLYELRHKKLPEDLIIDAVDRSIVNVKNLSKGQITPAVADFVVEKRAEAIMLLPEDMRTPERALKAVVGGWSFAALLLKPDQLTQEVLIRAVKDDYKVLMMLPKELRTEELEMEVLRQNGALLKHVQPDCRNPERCLAALTKGVEALAYIPDEILESASFQQQAARLNPELRSLWGRPPRHTSDCAPSI